MKEKNMVMSFKYEYNGIVKEFNILEPDLSSAIQEFELFLKASGFVFNGTLELLEEDENK